jgi:hypothetical protein
MRRVKRSLPGIVETFFVIINASGSWKVELVKKSLSMRFWHALCL